jgi:hypothetical protein
MVSCFSTALIRFETAERYTAIAPVRRSRRARGLGAAVVREPREGSVGWRSILDVPSGARIALWQPKV